MFPQSTSRPTLHMRVFNKRRPSTLHVPSPNPSPKIGSRGTSLVRRWRSPITTCLNNSYTPMFPKFISGDASLTILSANILRLSPTDPSFQRCPLIPTLSHPSTFLNPPAGKALPPPITYPSPHWSTDPILRAMLPRLPLATFPATNTPLSSRTLNHLRQGDPLKAHRVHHTPRLRPSAQDCQALRPTSRL
jgi:hypothetical protein